MVNNNLRLIYSKDSSDQKNRKLQKKHFVKSDQLGLFDDFKTIRIIFIPVADISSHLFINTLEKNDPYILLDTREFPDFFSVFISTDYALDEFKKHGIQYQRLPISLSSNNKEECWEQLSKLKTILEKHLEKKTNSPIVVLSSTSSNLNRVSDKLIGYIKQEVNQVTFEHVTD